MIAAAVISALIGIAVVVSGIITAIWLENRRYWHRRQL